MENIGLLTLNGYFNYGNRLQNYALEEALKSMKYHVETIKIDKNVESEYGLKYFTLSERLNHFRNLSSLDVYKKNKKNMGLFVYK